MLATLTHDHDAIATNFSPRAEENPGRREQSSARVESRWRHTNGDRPWQRKLHF